MQARLRWVRVLLVAVLFVLGAGTMTALRSDLHSDVFSVTL